MTPERIDRKKLKTGSLMAKFEQFSKFMKTLIRMISMLIYTYTPINKRHNAVEDIFNYFKINDSLACSGQPTKDQFKLIKNAGYTAVVNLSTQDFIECPVKDEPERVQRLGMKYRPVPVDFFNPEEEGFNAFLETMAALKSDNVWVHCSANARASSFIYRYRTIVLGEDKEDAIWDLREIWEPFGKWREFVYETEFKAASIPPEDL